MKRLAKRLVIGTRLEAPVRRVHHVLTGSRSSLYEAQTIEVMHRVLRSDSNAIDAGAFEGGMLRHICRYAPRGQHFAFEPTPENFDRLKDEFPGVRVLPFALGEQVGEVTFYRALDHPALSGLNPRSEYLGEERIEPIHVQMETLDRVIPKDFPISLLKIDVEGAELGVLRGGSETLRRTRPVIVFESGVGGADCFGTRPEVIHEFLQSVGLKVSLLSAWLHGAAAMSREGFREQFDRKLNYQFVAHP